MPHDCPSRDELEMLLSGPLDCDDAISSHIEECTACQSLLTLMVGRHHVGEHSHVRDVSGDRTQALLHRLANVVGESMSNSLPFPEIPGYDLEARVGVGGIASVYRARQHQPPRLVALKVLSHRLADDPVLRQRFQDEATALAMLDHSSIVPIYDLGHHKNVWYITMPYYPAGSLASYLDGEPISNSVAQEIALQVTSAMALAHAQKIVHRDLKPGNLLIDCVGKSVQLKRGFVDFSVRVADFGIAKSIEHQRKVTRTGDLLGTPAYMAPEQIHEDQGEIGPATDVFAIGVMLYEMLTGRVPFLSDKVATTLVQILHDSPVSPRKRNPKVPRELETICLHCLEKKPERRYASAAALHDDLIKLREGRPVSVRPVGWVGASTKWAQRNRRVAILMATCSVLLLGLLATWLRMTFQLQSERDKAIKSAIQLANERDVAEHDLERAHRAVRQYLESVRSDMLLGSSNLGAVQAELLRRGEAYYLDLLNADGRAYPSESRKRIMREIRLEYAQLQFELGKINYRNDECAQAINYFQRVDRLCHELDSEHPDFRFRRLQGANLLSWEASLRKCEQLSAAREKLTAAKNLFQSMSIARELDPGYANWYLADCWLRVARLEDLVNNPRAAERAFEHSIRHADLLTDVSDFQLLRTKVYRERGDFRLRQTQIPDAEGDLTQALAIAERICQTAAPRLSRYEDARITCLEALANFYDERSLMEKSSQFSQRAKRLQRELDLRMPTAEEDVPRSTQWRLEQALRLANVDFHEGKSRRACERYAEIEVELADHPEIEPPFREEMTIRVNHQLASLDVQSKRYHSAIDRFGKLEALGVQLSDGQCTELALCLAFTDRDLESLGRLQRLSKTLPSANARVAFIGAAELRLACVADDEKMVTCVNAAKSFFRALVDARHELTDTQRLSLLEALEISEDILRSDPRVAQSAGLAFIDWCDVEIQRLQADCSSSFPKLHQNVSLK